MAYAKRDDDDERRPLLLCPRARRPSPAPRAKGSGWAAHGYGASKNRGHAMGVLW